jgi:hypothetical protein
VRCTRLSAADLHGSQTESEAFGFSLQHVMHKPVARARWRFLARDAADIGMEIPQIPGRSQNQFFDSGSSILRVVSARHTHKPESKFRTAMAKTESGHYRYEELFEIFGYNIVWTTRKKWTTL